jgi:hypothetical protein
MQPRTLHQQRCGPGLALLQIHDRRRGAGQRAHNTAVAAKADIGPFRCKVTRLGVWQKDESLRGLDGIVQRSAKSRDHGAGFAGHGQRARKCLHFLLKVGAAAVKQPVHALLDAGAHRHEQHRHEEDNDGDQHRIVGFDDRAGHQAGAVDQQEIAAHQRAQHDGICDALGDDAVGVHGAILKHGQAQAEGQNGEQRRDGRGIQGQRVAAGQRADSHVEQPDDAHHQRQGHADQHGIDLVALKRHGGVDAPHHHAGHQHQQAQHGHACGSILRAQRHERVGRIDMHADERGRGEDGQQHGQEAHQRLAVGQGGAHRQHKRQRSNRAAHERRGKNPQRDQPVGGVQVEQAGHEHGQAGQAEDDGTRAGLRAPHQEDDQRHAPHHHA